MKNYTFYASIIILLSIFWASFFAYPQYQKLNSLKKEIFEKEKELSSQEKYFENLQKTAEELKKYETTLSKIDSALPQNPSLPDLLNFIQKASSQSGLSLKNISPAVISPLEKATPSVNIGSVGEAVGGAPSERYGEIKTMKINLLLVGSYSNFKNFLSLLEKSARLIDVEEISFALSKEETGLFNFSLTVKVYSY
jgi:Tfp pilus assembly protein PilO